MIDQILLKVTARCNLNCDYCYVFNMGDQSWQNLPRLMDKKVMVDVVDFIEKTYHDSSLIPSITSHGGEPLMYGVEPIEFFIEELKNRMPDLIPEYSIQTNMFGKGIINSLLKLDELNVAISASTDGDQVAMDRHRRTKNGQSSFKSVDDNISLAYKEGILNGLISVIDPKNEVTSVLKYLSKYNKCPLELLPIDSNWDIIDHTSVISTAYWFSSAFKLWAEDYSQLNIRYFRHIIERTAGINVGTDAFGGGDPNLISIEPDGSVHGLDVLKSIDSNQSNTGLNIQQHSMKEILSSDHFVLHKKLSSENSISQECISCSVKMLCHSGSVPHRWNGTDFTSKSVHCPTLHALFSLANAGIYEANVHSTFDEHLKSVFKKGNISPYLIKGQHKCFDTSEISNSISFYDGTSKLEFINSNELCIVENQEVYGKEIEKALLLINQWNPAISSRIIISNINFCIVNPISGATSDLISMTHSQFPHTIFLNILDESGGFLEVDNIAENIIHETIHLTLDVLLAGKSLSKSSGNNIRVPWRTDLRPICGVLHGSLVFILLSEFRTYIGDHEQSNEMKNMVEKVVEQLETNKNNMTPEGLAVFEFIKGGL